MKKRRIHETETNRNKQLQQTSRHRTFVEVVGETQSCASGYVNSPIPENSGGEGARAKGTN